MFPLVLLSIFDFIDFIDLIDFIDFIDFRYLLLIWIFTTNNDRNKVMKQIFRSGTVARRLRIIVQEHLSKSCLRMKIHGVPRTRGDSHVMCYYFLSVFLPPPPKFHYNSKVKIYFVYPLFEQPNIGQTLNCYCKIFSVFLPFARRRDEVARILGRAGSSYSLLCL